MAFSSDDPLKMLELCHVALRHAGRPIFREKGGERIVHLQYVGVMEDDSPAIVVFNTHGTPHPHTALVFSPETFAQKFYYLHNLSAGAPCL